MGVISGFFSYLLVLVGYLSNSKYAMMSSARVVVMGLNLEILLNFLLLGLAVLADSLSFAQLGSLQTG
jgi:NADH:ubiquinone oxidoreductase subunit H